MPVYGNVYNCAFTTVRAKQLRFFTVLVIDLPHREAELQLRGRFGDTAHHILSLVLTGVDYAADGRNAPISGTSLNNPGRAHV